MDMKLRRDTKSQFGKNTPNSCNCRSRKKRKEKCIKIGMNDYISKPIARGIIEETLIKWVI
jgi:CheY-like chemotaxis protein